MKSNSLEFHRESCRKQHRVVAHYLALQAWVRGLDCIVLDRADLQRFFGLERFKGTRVSWLTNDLKPWFPHHRCLYYTGWTLASLYLSRSPLDKFFPQGTMRDEKRLHLMSLKPGSPRAGKFMAYKRPTKPPSEERIISQLALLAAGLDVPKPYGSRRRKRS